VRSCELRWRWCELGFESDSEGVSLRDWVGDTSSSVNHVGK
jgi:hypothetical protein